MPPPDASAGVAPAQVAALAEHPAGLFAPAGASPSELTGSVGASPAAVFGPVGGAPDAAARGLLLAAAVLLAAASVAFAALALPSALPLARAVVLRSLVGALVQVGEPPRHVDAAAVHGGGGIDAARELAALRLWREGRADHLVAMGGPLPAGDPDRTFARAVERRLRANGAPDSAIIRLDQGGSTAGELQALRQLAEAEGWHQVVLSSSRWHTRRITLLASQVFRGSSIAWTVVAPPDFGFDAATWWDDPVARTIVLNEWLKLGFALFFPTVAT